MIRFRYDTASIAFVNATIERFAQSRNIAAITRVQAYQDLLEGSCLNEVRQLEGADATYRWLFPLPISDIDNFVEVLGFNAEGIRLSVPLNSLAVIGVLFDLMISRQRNFRSTQKIFSQVLQQDIELRDDRERLLFDNEIARRAESQEPLFFSLYDLFIREHPSLLVNSTQRGLPSQPPTSIRQLVEDIFDYAAHEAARPLIKRIQGEADARSQ